MWYTGVGSSVRLADDEQALLVKLGSCLADLGWKLRCGGRGIVDDKLAEGAILSGGEVQAIVPFQHYRGNAEGDREGWNIHAFDSLGDSVQIHALAQAESVASNAKITSPLQRNLLASSAPLVLGLDLLMPARFVITWVCHDDKSEFHEKDVSGSADPLSHTQDSPIFRLAQSRGIPVFNLACVEHNLRIMEFIHRCSSQCELA